MDDFHCSFCGKRRREVFKLISGPRVFICDECTALCVDIIEKDKAAASTGPQPETKAEKTEPSEQIHCSFCGKSQREVEKMIAGPTVYICNGCVDICVDFVEEAKEEQAKKEKT